MKPMIRLTAFVLLAILPLASSPRSSEAGASVARTAKNCYFIRNGLPCPCPSATQARVVAKASVVTAAAIGTAVRATGSALLRSDRHHDARATGAATTTARPQAKPRSD